MMLQSYSIPTTIAGLNSHDILAATKSDKKMNGSKIKFTIIKSLGEANSYLDFTDDDLIWSIEKVLNDVN